MTDLQFCQATTKKEDQATASPAQPHAALGGAWSHHPASVCFSKKPTTLSRDFFRCCFQRTETRITKMYLSKRTELVGHYSSLRCKRICLPTLPSNLGRNQVELIICLSNALQGFLITGSANVAEKTKM